MGRPRTTGQQDSQGLQAHPLKQAQEKDDERSDHGRWWQDPLGRYWVVCPLQSGTAGRHGDSEARMSFCKRNLAGQSTDLTLATQTLNYRTRPLWKRPPWERGAPHPPVQDNSISSGARGEGEGP